MRLPLAATIAGAISGCPGAVEAHGPDEPHVPGPLEDGAGSVPARHTRRRPRRGPWVTAAALVLLVYDGLLPIVYGPVVYGTSVAVSTAPWSVDVRIPPLAIAWVLSVITGIGLLRLRGWARSMGGLLAGFALAVSIGSMLAGVDPTDVARVDWVGVAGNVVVLFAVVRRWPTDSVGAG